MRNYKILSFLFIILPLAVFSQAPESFEMSLKQCIDYSFKNQNRVLNSELDEKIALSKVHEITGIGLPQITSSFDLKNFLVVPTQLIPASAFGGPDGLYIPAKFGLKYNATAGFDASQIIFDGSYIVGLQTSKTFLELAKKSTERSKIEVTIAISKAYYNVLINQERMKLIEANVDRLKKLYDDTKALNENGFVEKIDVDRIRLNYNNVQVEQTKLHDYLELSYYLLKFQMGMDVKSTLTLTDKLQDIQTEEVIESKPGFDYSRKVEYQLLQGQEKMNRLALRRDKYQFLPSIVAYGSFASNAQRPTFDIFDNNKSWYGIQIVGAKVSLPIFSGLQRNYKVQQSKIAVMKAENDLKMLVQSIDLDLRSTETTLKNSISSLKVQKETMALAEEVNRVAKIKYDQGVGSNLEVINAEASLKEAQTNYFNALYEAYIARIEYDRANGNIKF